MNKSDKNNDIEVYEYLKSIVIYDKIIGKFFWKHRKELKSRDVNWNIKNANKEIIYNVKGYISIRFTFNQKPKRVYAHRLAWFIMKLEIPNCFIDHLNRIKSDNRIENLRVVDYRTNNKNLTKSKKNSSGITGVSYYKRYDKWLAHCCVNSVRNYLGYYSTILEAEKAVKDFRALNGFTDSHGTD